MLAPSPPALLRRGDEHRRRLEEIDVKIVVSGTRGKSGMTERLYDVLASRGYDAYAKVTGNHPISIYDGREHPIERGERVTLYENVSELRKYTPADALILENQGITDYTTRIMNETFGDSDVLVITNVRQDHRDTLGSDRAALARSFARAVPEGTHVVNGERDDALRDYLERELEAVGATVSHVEVPPEHEHVPGAETVYGVNDVLAAIDEPPLSDDLVESMLEQYRVDWRTLPSGRIYNAADVNDVESTEMVRRALVSEGERIQPLLYLRADRRARTASFYAYLEELYENGAIERAHVVGGHSRLFKRRASFPVVRHDETATSAAAVLDEMLADDWPILAMGNTVAAFMRDLEDEIERRAPLSTKPDAVAAHGETTPGEETEVRDREEGGDGERQRLPEPTR